MKKVLALVLALILIVALAACGDSKDSKGSKNSQLVGTWKLDSDWVLETAAKEAGMTAEEMKKTLATIGMSLDDLLGAMTFTFENDGKGKVNMEGEEASFTYKVDGNKLTMTSEGETETTEFSVKDGKLTMTVEGQKMVFVKAK